MAIRHVVRKLAEAPKDRSAEHLIRLCRDYDGHKDDLAMVAGLTVAQRLKLLADNRLPLQVRATAAWFASGLDIGDENRVGRGDLPGLLDVLRATGVPEALVVATGIAARSTREPICLMVPLIWQEAFRRSAPEIFDQPVPSSPTITGIPAYAWDKHTARGKAAIHRLARGNAVVRTVLETHVSEHRARADWSGSDRGSWKEPGQSRT